MKITEDKLLKLGFKKRKLDPLLDDYYLEYELSRKTRNDCCLINGFYNGRMFVYLLPYEFKQFDTMKDVRLLIKLFRK